MSVKPGEDIASTLSAVDLADKRLQYWRRSLRITGALLAIWFVVTFVLGYYARDLSFTFFGWPFSFWVASQGALIVYCALVWYYARLMNRLDRQYGVADEA